MRSISCIHAASLLDDNAGGLLTRRPEKTSSREGCISVTSCFHLQSDLQQRDCPGFSPDSLIRNALQSYE